MCLQRECFLYLLCIQSLFYGCVCVEIQNVPVSCVVLEVEKQFMEAAKTNDVETMRSLGRGLNANAKNVVGQTICPNITQISKAEQLWSFVEMDVFLSTTELPFTMQWLAKTRKLFSFFYSAGSKWIKRIR